MSTNDTQSASARKSPFWRFSIAFYAVPGVAPACIELQDRAGVDVNILFFLLWNATQNRVFDAAGVTAIEQAAGPWREMAVVPVRQVRRALKSPPPFIAPDAAESLRNRIKAAELEAERLQQEALYALAQSATLGREAASPVEAARTSVASYQTLLAPMPAAALEAVLSAFATFDAPPPDGA